MPTIFDYTDFRKFLRDFYREQKKAHPWYSYALLAKKAGLRSKGHVSGILNGNQNLSKTSIFRFADACGMNEKEFAYFEALVAFNQSDNPKQHRHFFNKVMEFNIRDKTRQRLIDQFEFYSEWYHNTIRELATWFDFRENFVVLSKMLKPAITPDQARNSVKLLLRLGLLRKTGNRYEQSCPNITTGNEVRDIAVVHFHSQNLQLASESIHRCNQNDRDISCIVAGLSKGNIAQVKTEIQKFRRRLIEIINRDNTSTPEAVYHINIQFFPTSEKNG
jgi:uncharacterized protein (TIGR02147 family)